MASDSLTITDNRTGKTYEVPIKYGTFPLYVLPSGGPTSRTSRCRKRTSAS